MTDTRFFTMLIAFAIAIGIVTTASTVIAADDTVNVWMSQHQTALTASLDAKLKNGPVAKRAIPSVQPSVVLPVIHVTTEPVQRLEATPNA